jgi:DNA-binding PadR family transcriptional regulator
MLDQESNHASHTPEELAQWLERIGQTEQEVRDTLSEGADLSVRRALVLAEFIEREQLDVSEESVAEELDSLVEQMVASVDGAEQSQQVRALIDTAEGRASIRDRLSTQTAVERLVEICSQPEEEAAERPRGSRRRRGSRGGDAEEDSQSAGAVDSAESRDQASETQEAEAGGDSGGSTGDDGDENEEQGE